MKRTSTERRKNKRFREQHREKNENNTNTKINTDQRIIGSATGTCKHIDSHDDEP